MLRNSLFNLLGGLLRLSLGIVTIPILIKYIGINQYGLYSIIYAILSMAVLFEWSISVSVIVFLNRIKTSLSVEKTEYVNVINSSVIVVFIIALITTIILISTLPVVKSVYGKLSTDEINTLIKCYYIVILLVWVRSYQQILIGIEQFGNFFGHMNLINSIVNIFLSIGTIVIAVSYKSIIIIFYWQLLIQTSSLIVHWIFCKNRSLLTSGYSVKINFKQVYKMTSFCSRTWAGSLGGVLFSQGDRLVLGTILSSDVVGLYSAMTTVAAQINAISAMPVQAIIPALGAKLSKQRYSQTELEAVSHKKDLTHLAVRSFKMNLYIAIFLGALMVSLSKEILYFISEKGVYQYRYYNLQGLFITLCVIYTIYSVNAFGYYAMIALEDISRFVYIQLAAGILTLLSIVYLSNNFGLQGAILGNSVYMITGVMSYWACRKLNIPFTKLSIGFLLSLSVFLCFAIVIAVTNNALVKIMLSCVIFVYLASVTERELEVFKNPSALGVPRRIEELMQLIYRKIKFLF